MESKIIFFEGQPGSGKSTLSQYIYQQIQLNGESVYWLDEYEHDGAQFSEFWKEYDNADENIINTLLSCWKDLIKGVEKSNRTVLMDSAFLSYTLYLLNLEISKDKINSYFIELNNILKDLTPRIIFLKGDTETIIGRACKRRGYNWTNFTIEKIEEGPYQRTRNRTGFNGMVEYFSDAQDLYFELLPLSSFPVLQIDVTEENWSETEDIVLSWLGYGRINSDYILDDSSFENYLGEYQVPEDFPAKGEKLKIVIEDNQLILKGTYWKDYKLFPKSETHFLIKGIPMELKFKVDKGQISGFDYTFINRKTYFCTKIG